VSIHVQNYVWTLKMENPNRKYVAIALAHFANDDGTNAFPSQATLVERTGLGEQTVRRSLRELVTTGVIVVSRTPNQRRSTCYVFVLPEGMVTFRPSATAPLRVPRGATVTVRGATVEGSEVPPRHPIDKERSIEREAQPSIDELERRRERMNETRAALRRSDPGVTVRLP
jgi:hypothetical protein